MASSNYPFNQDVAFNSFTITDPTIVQATLGRTYAQSELVPVNVVKVLVKSFTDISIKTLPLSQFVTISEVSSLATDLNDEAGNQIQGGIFQYSLRYLYNYWKDELMLNASGYATPLNAPMVVATPTDVKFVESSGLGGSFHIQINYDLVIFVVPTSIYA